MPGLLTVEPPLPLCRASPLYGCHGSLQGLGDEDQKSNPARTDGEKASLLPVLRGLGDGVLREAGECLGVKLVLTGSSLCRVLAGLDHQPTLPGVTGCLPAGRPGDGELLDNVDTAGGKPCISVTIEHTHAQATPSGFNASSLHIKHTTYDTYTVTERLSDLQKTCQNYLLTPFKIISINTGLIDMLLQL